MEPLIVLAITFALLWLLFIRPQQRRVRAHQALVATVQAGDQVVLSAGIYGRVVEAGPEDLRVEVAPGVALRVARQAVLRRVEDATGPAASPGEGLDAAPTGDEPPAPGHEPPASGHEPPADDRGPTGPDREG
ncbi:MAG TPA: preprotein translocase subunit YajC [Acidimicrobiales bacterium]